MNRNIKKGKDVVPVILNHSDNTAKPGENSGINAGASKPKTKEGK